MYRVSSVPRPRLGLFLRECMGFGAKQGALYGMLCGALYGLTFIVIAVLYVGPIGIAFGMIGMLLGIPIGMISGTVIGTLDAMICGYVLYSWRITLPVHNQAFKVWIGIFSFLAYAIIGSLFTYDLMFFSLEKLYFILVPALIAGICGYRATSDLLRWYVKRWVLGVPESDAQQPALNP